MLRESSVLVWGALGTVVAVGAAGMVVGAVPAALLLVGALAGVIVGRAAYVAGMRERIGSLEGAMAAVAESRNAVLPDPSSLGPLAGSLEAVARLRDTLALAIEEAAIDRLTRVANRSMLLATLFEEVERAARYGRPLSLAFVDIDHFKAINDTYGHDAGDEILRAVADTLSSNLRRSDTIGRYGGEEFVIVLPEMTVDEATAVAEKLRQLVARQRVRVTGGDELSVTASIGLAGGRGQPLRVDDLLRDADAAMYAAKSLGRNQTYVFAEADDESARIPRAPISPAARAAAAELGEVGRRAAETALASVIMPLPHYSGQPSALIATIAVRLARQLELPDAEVERIRVASLLHDIGKVGVPEEILEKPGPLTADEWQKVVQHPRVGQEILQRVAAVKDAATIILHHHERFSGHGYPHGLRGADIPLGARIVAIADAYDAMLHDRPYRAAIGHEAAIAELRASADIQFDPELVELFCSLFAKQPPRADESLLVTPLDDVSHRPPAQPGRRRRAVAG